MGEIRKTYSIEFKQRAVKMFINNGMGYKTVAKEHGINDKMVRRWVAYYEREGLEGLKEKRGNFKGVSRVRKRKDPLSMEEELVHLRAENEYLKKLWELQSEQNNNSKNI